MWTFQSSPLSWQISDALFLETKNPNNYFLFMP